MSGQLEDKPVVHVCDVTYSSRPDQHRIAQLICFAAPLVWPAIHAANSHPYESEYWNSGIGPLCGIPQACFGHSFDVPSFRRLPTGLFNVMTNGDLVSYDQPLKHMAQIFIYVVHKCGGR